MIKIFLLSRISQKGFTLIELLVVVAIIGVLSSLLMTNFIGIRQRARDAQRKSDMKQIQASLEFFRSDQGRYPLSTTNEYPSTCGSAFTAGIPPVIYMQKIPCDPLGSGKYTYTSTGGNTYTLVGCLENGSDQDIDKDATGNKINCSVTGVLWQYTLNNP